MVSYLDGIGYTIQHLRPGTRPMAYSNFPKEKKYTVK